jgi:hypothetical protein
MEWVSDRIWIRGNIIVEIGSRNKYIYQIEYILGELD